MKKHSVIVVLILALIVAGTAWASQAAAGGKHASAAKKMDTKATKTHVASGTIVSFTENNLVLEHKVKGKPEQTTFELSPSTKKTGNLENGAKAAVHYTSEGGRNMATTVQVHPAKATKAKASKTKS